LYAQQNAQSMMKSYRTVNAAFRSALRKSSARDASPYLRRSFDDFSLKTAPQVRAKTSMFFASQQKH
jgi:hypothetical protein